MTRLQTLTQDPFFVGFDRIFDRMHTMNTLSEKQGSYPPYNLIKTDENRYAIELALAGFTQEDLDITIEDGVLSIEGKVEKDDENDYLHKGIGMRHFKRNFTLADTIEVRGADLVNGILTVELENVIPEEKKPRKIEIGNPQAELLLEE